MKRWEKFRTFKERGEWVELVFMAAAALHGYHVLQPWGECLEYDVGIERNGKLLRVQVKSSTRQAGVGYCCQLHRNGSVKEPYSLERVDFFAAYIIPVGVWYLIPAVVILKPPRRVKIRLCPTPDGGADYKYEHYREAWGLLAKDGRELSRQRTHP
jgi:hypothetical protein